MSCWSFVPAAEEPGKVTLLVGVNNYNRRKLEDRPLRFAERDVQELAVVLQGQKFAVRTLTGPDATKVNIEEALTGLLKGPKKEIVVVAFAGHGMQLPLKDEGGNLVRDAQGRELSDAFFCPFDTVAGEGSTMISLTRLVERLDNEGGTNLFLVDACRDDFDPHRGLGKRSLSGDELVGWLPGNSAILFSCSKGQQALEHEQAGGGHGVFFHQVIEGLRGAAADPETGEVGWDDLVGYVRKRVNRLARELDPEGVRKADERFSGNLQTPQQITNLVATPILARHVKPREAVMPRPADVPDRTVTGLDTITTRTAGITLKRIPAGTFQMGSPDSDKDAYNNEKPQHLVRITRAFYLGVTEVTQAQYEAVMGNNPSYFSATCDGKGKVAGQSTGQHPVEWVSWLDAVTFCNKLSELEGRRPFYEIAGETVRVPDWKAPGYRLPTEAEWEYACGGDPADLNGHAWFEVDSGGVTHPVGKKRANRFGLHDMLGNVWEWCWDANDKDYYKQLPSDDPTGPDAGAPFRMFRGGGWQSYPYHARSENRAWRVPDYRTIDLGFRLALVQ
ncbi:MAG: SUMF1/EgtB/PvdO family nonheme iron enzyme [Isosphaeraceae bacterium]